MVAAQTEEARNAIKQFCGCFEVTFEYAETFPRKEGYQLAKPYKTGAIEHVILEEESPDKLVLQHMLVISDSMIIKHWRQDWEYEPAYSFDFAGNQSWEVLRTQVNHVHGKWIQKVYEVNDSPRYAGGASWNFADGKHAWENSTDAPLPRREYTTRDDYQILRRTNRLYIEDWGWIHEQDYEMIVLNDSGREVLVEEKGRNVYRRIDDAQCSAAKTQWESQRKFWNQVRYTWDELLRQPGAFTMQDQYGNKSYDDALKELRKQDQSGSMIDKNKIKGLLQNYCLHIASER